MMECKKALTEAEGDMAKAEELLRVKLGTKAGKAASRVTAEGVVASFINGNLGALIEVNSETDFVSKNDSFIAMANAACLLYTSSGERPGSIWRAASASISRRATPLSRSTCSAGCRRARSSSVRSSTRRPSLASKSSSCWLAMACRRAWLYCARRSTAAAGALLLRAVLRQRRSQDQLARVRPPATRRVDVYKRQRFNHLFRAEMGASLRSYRVWSQVRLAMAGLAVSPRLTDAALHGDFADSAHFSRMFRQTFGMTPSSVLKLLKQVTLLD